MERLACTPEIVCPHCSRTFYPTIEVAVSVTKGASDDGQDAADGERLQRLREAAIESVDQRMREYRFAQKWDGGATWLPSRESLMESIVQALGNERPFYLPPCHSKLCFKTGKHGARAFEVQATSSGFYLRFPASVNVPSEILAGLKRARTDVPGERAFIFRSLDFVREHQALIQLLWDEAIRRTRGRKAMG